MALYGGLNPQEHDKVLAGTSRIYCVKSKHGVFGDFSQRVNTFIGLKFESTIP
jgi:hypothetical protein